MALTTQEWSRRKLIELDTPPKPKPNRVPKVKYCKYCGTRLVWRSRSVLEMQGNMLVCRSAICRIGRNEKPPNNTPSRLQVELLERSRYRVDIAQKIIAESKPIQQLNTQRNTAMDRGAGRIDFNKLPEELKSRIRRLTAE